MTVPPSAPIAGASSERPSSRSFLTWRLSRAERSRAADWWLTIDKISLLTVLVLLMLGLVMSFAASPPIARDLDLANEFHFVQKHMVFLVPTLALVVGVSMLSHRFMVRLGLGLFVLAIFGMVAALFFGAEVKGARRWIDLGFFQMQPSELAKPALILVSAWLFSEHQKRPDLHANLYAATLFVLVAGLLIAQPDIGQTMLVTAVWGALFFVSGMSWLWITLLAGLAVGGLASAYLFVPHVTSRIDRFLNPEAGDNHQTDRAIESFVEGGLFGRGPGEGIVKEHLPDSHTDFLFAVVAEEFGIFMCLLIVALYLFFFARCLRAALSTPEPFVRFAIVGLVALLGFQAAVNMGVNMQLLPAKGMTLPFLSYGGSSLLSVGLTSGVLLGLTRRTARMGASVPGPLGASALAWRWNVQRG